MLARNLIYCETYTNEYHSYSYNPLHFSKSLQKVLYQSKNVWQRIENGELCQVKGSIESSDLLWLILRSEYKGEL